MFALSGRGLKTHLIVNSATGKLADTNFAVTDKAAQVCPVGAILHKRQAFVIPIGERLYDRQPINLVGDLAQSNPQGASTHG